MKKRLPQKEQPFLIEHFSLNIENLAKHFAYALIINAFRGLAKL